MKQKNSNPETNPPKERIRTESVRGNMPECPKCKNWNALLDGFDYTETRVHYYQCRDCGFKVNATDLVVVIKRLDKPGMGHLSTYTPELEVNGEDYHFNL